MHEPTDPMSDTENPRPECASPEAVVMQFAKWPVPGRVKTRLSPLLGDDGAMNAHVRLSRRVLANLAEAGLPLQFWWDRALVTPPVAADPILADLETLGVRQCIQQGNDLGQRMHGALELALQRHDKAVIVGSDCPSVEARYVQAALALLDRHDVVMGPSDDGGYVLLAAKRTVPAMLDDIEWGSGRVLVQTRDRLDRLGLSHASLEPRWDVDEPEDWQRFLRELVEAPEG